MIRRRGYGFHKPPQHLTGRMDDFPLVPETPTYVSPPPILPPITTSDAQAVAEKLVHDSAPAVADQPRAAQFLPPQQSQPIKPVTHTIDIVVQPDHSAERTEEVEEDNQEADARSKVEKILSTAKLQKLSDSLLRTLSDSSVPKSPTPRPPKKGNRSKVTQSRAKDIRTNQTSASARRRHRTSWDHHARHCTVCNHPERDAIEDEFLQWHNPSDIGHDYEVGRRAVYRHARAAGLFARRERNLRFALGHMVQQAMSIKPTSDAILRAIRAYSCLNRQGQWTDPPSHVIVSSGTAAFAAQRALPSATVEASLSRAKLLSRVPPESAALAQPTPAPSNRKSTRHSVPSRNGRK